MIETLTQLGRVITEGAANTMAAAITRRAPSPSRTRTRAVRRARACDRRFDGRGPRAGHRPERGRARDRAGVGTQPVPERVPPAAVTEWRAEEATAVEVRGRFGDRWVDGFEICEVTTTADGPRYRLRRHRDGAVLPELFDAASIRHVETFDQLSSDQLVAEQCKGDEAGAGPTAPGTASSARARPIATGSTARRATGRVPEDAQRSVVETGSKPSRTARCHTWNGACPPPRDPRTRRGWRASRRRRRAATTGRSRRRRRPRRGRRR